MRRSFISCVSVIALGLCACGPEDAQDVRERFGASSSGSQLKESVTCVFAGSQSVEECYSATGLGCKGIGSCTVTVTGSKGEKIDWKSSCGGYATTVVDGVDEKIQFACP